jgi:hypothetical protein
VHLEAVNAKTRQEQASGLMDYAQQIQKLPSDWANNAKVNSSELSMPDLQYPNAYERTEKHKTPDIEPCSNDQAPNRPEEFKRTESMGHAFCTAYIVWIHGDPGLRRSTSGTLMRLGLWKGRWSSLGSTEMINER